MPVVRLRAPLSELVTERITGPLGLTDLRMGCPAAEQHRLADVTHVGRAWTNEELVAKGFPPLPVTEVTEENLQRFNEPEVREVGVPGGGGTSTAADLALFYQALLAGGQGVWRPETIADARRIRTPNFRDLIFRKPANRALGIVVAEGPDKHVLGFGRTASDATFDARRTVSAGRKGSSSAEMQITGVAIDGRNRIELDFA